MVTLLLWLALLLTEVVPVVEREPDTEPQPLAEELKDTEAELLEDTLPVMLPKPVPELLVLPLLLWLALLLTEVV